MKKIIVTTSWDDGSPWDYKMADLLDKYSLKGTFYVAKQHSRVILQPSDIKKLSMRHEIGAHTLTHPELDNIDQEQIFNEVVKSKKYLESIINEEVKMFCYPKGKFNRKIKQIVQSAGFVGARTNQKFSVKLPSDLYEFGVTLQVYPFPFRKKKAKKYFKNIFLFEPLKNNYKKIRELDLPVSSFFSWYNLAINLFIFAQKKGEIFHLYGHSWEVEKYNMWKDLEMFFKYIKKDNGNIYLKNSESLDCF